MYGSILSLLLIALRKINAINREFKGVEKNYKELE